MSAVDLNRPDTPLGRALARRAPAFDFPAGDVPDVSGLLDLTRPERQITAEPVREAATVALERGETHYTARTGILPLRQAIAGASTADGFPATAEEVAVTNGGEEAIYIALQATLQRGDRAFLCEPVAPRVVDVIRFVGAEPVILPDAADARLEGGKVLLVSSPSGLSSLDMPDDRLAALIESAVRNDVSVIVDRSATPNRYQAAPAFGRPDLAEGVITVGSFAGSYGLEGWQVGYFTSPPASMERLAGLKESMSISTTTVSQFAALAAIEHAGELLPARREHFTRRRDMVIALLDAHGIRAIHPDVYPWLLVDVRSLGMDDKHFTERLARESGVIVEPASRYGKSLSGYVRVNLGVEETMLIEGVNKLAAFVEAR